MKLPGFDAVGMEMKSKLRGLGTLIAVLPLVFAMLIGLLGACTPTQEEEPPPVVETPIFPLTVTDQAGRLVTIEKIPEKIISLAPSNTEIVFALGLGDRVVAVTEFCNYPEAALDKPKITGGVYPDIEQIVNLKPDLILAVETHMAEVIPALERFGLTVVVVKTQTETLDEVLETITLVGRYTGKTDEASQLVTEMRNRIKAITDKIDNLPESQRPRVLYIGWHDPIIINAPGTLGHALIEKAGGINIFQDLTGFPMISLEEIIQANPQVIVADIFGEGVDMPYQFALTDPRLEGVDARINGRVYGVITDLTGRPGPRIVEGLEMLAGMIHPEIFPEFFDKYVGSD